MSVKKCHSDIHKYIIEYVEKVNREVNEETRKTMIEWRKLMEKMYAQVDN